MAYKQETITPYSNGEEKSKQVETMFDNIAHSYDLLNHRLSFGIDYLWRKKAIRQLMPYKPSMMLDIATGTGDFAIMSAQKPAPEKNHRHRHIRRHDAHRRGKSQIIRA